MTPTARTWQGRFKLRFLRLLGRFYDLRSTQQGKLYIRLRPRKQTGLQSRTRRQARIKAFGIALLGLFYKVEVNSKSKKGKVQLNMKFSQQ